MRLIPSQRFMHMKVERGNFEIEYWPRDGPGMFRKLDPNTGNEAGTTEGYVSLPLSDLY